MKLNFFFWKAVAHFDQRFTEADGLIFWFEHFSKQSPTCVKIHFALYKHLNRSQKTKYIKSLNTNMALQSYSKREGHFKENSYEIDITHLKNNKIKNTRRSEFSTTAEKPAKLPQTFCRWFVGLIPSDNPDFQKYAGGDETCLHSLYEISISERRE